jgi:hypothetical protein
MNTPYKFILIVVERDTPCTPLLLVMERDTPCTSILLVVERDTPCTFILLAVEIDTPCPSTLLVVERDTQCTSILLVMERDTPCTSKLLVVEREGNNLVCSKPFLQYIGRPSLLVRLVSFRTLVVQQTEFLYNAGFFRAAVLQTSLMRLLRIWRLPADSGTQVFEVGGGFASASSSEFGDRDLDPDLNIAVQIARKLEKSNLEGTIFVHIKNVRKSPGCLSRIPGPNFSPSRILDSKSATQENREKIVLPVCSHKYHKIETYLIFELVKKKIGVNLQRIVLL